MYILLLLFFLHLFPFLSILIFSIAQDIFYNKKERKRISLKREYIGDYIGYLDNPGLRSLLDKKERVVFADDVTKYDRRFKPQKRTLLLTAQNLYLIALVSSFSSFLDQLDEDEDIHPKPNQSNVTIKPGKNEGRTKQGKDWIRHETLPSHHKRLVY